MNSSGIKRGLATTAVTALAVAGLPLIASSASAADPQIIVVSKGPVRNGGTVGSQVLLRVKDVEAANAAPTATYFKLARQNLTESVDIPATQDLDIVAQAVAAEGSANDTNKTDGYHEVTLAITAQTQSAGGTANFAIYYDADNGAGADYDGNPDFDLGEANVKDSLVTAGAPASITVSPASQTAGQNVPSGNYTVTILDGSGNTTQLSGTENFDLTSGAGVSFTPDAEISASEAKKGVATFKATGSNKGLFTINVKGDATQGPVGVDGQAQLDVIGASSKVHSDEIDIVTGKDSWDGFGDDSYGSTTAVRADQKSVTLNFKSPTNKNTVIAVTATGAGVTFDNGASTSKTLTTTLNGNGEGSLTFTPDATTIGASDTLTFSSPSFDDDDVATVTDNLIVEFQARGFVVNESADTYISAFGGTVSPVVTVTDQFGDPYTGVYVTVERDGGANDGAESERKPVNENGQVTFDLTDTKATATSKASDTLIFRVYPGELGGVLATNPTPRPTIVYTADGKGADFTFTVDSVSPTGSAYDPNSVSALPLVDTNANSGDEYIDLNIVGGTTGAPVTVTVDNGALVLKGTETRLAQGAASKSGKVGDNFDIIGTKAGVVNVTVESGGITKTGQVSVRTFSQMTPFTGGTVTSAVATARNLAVEGPSAATAGQVVEFVVTVTDAFGNPVRGVNPSTDLSTLVTGPGTPKGNSGASDASGQITYMVELDQDADNAVNFKVTGMTTVGQFGAAADRITSADTTNTGPGLPASENVATASIAEVVNIEELEQAVEDAEEALAEAQAELAVAQGNLDVAAAELAVAQANVDSLTAKKQKLREKLNKAKAKGNKQKAKTTRKKLRNTKRSLRAAQDELTIATTKVDAAQSIVEIREGDVADAEADLAEAEQNLEDAQNG